ncbi:outer membrane beta-barrel family protein [Pedobacter caeni]|uniref:Outer membrane receptor proteins, mostly Fe transport n=1 Tax=Pedobacter caeni TaxID=288992 RepID=A0A1M4UIT2_9SPHI|nr:outer membrane beta-barrel family protein [Pedobacter caeni]SHE56692.1 Outer membrane receptor proteins, mostly Fe transport [Pedobacter caeni]
MRLTLLFICFFFSSVIFCNLLAQSYPGVSGRILDSVSRQPLEFITVGLFNKEGKVMLTTVTSPEGKFDLKATSSGASFIRISFVGYVTKQLPVAVGGDKVFNDILLSATVSQLSEVNVTALKKMVIQKPGMLIYDAGNDPGNKGGTAADVLRKAPVLNVDAQGNVSMRGSKNIKILIDGKYSGQMARSPADALNMMPSNIIASVEIITTPSAKYDAEGAAGVINIITKKDRKQMNGALEAVASNWEQALNPRFSMANQKWNINVNAHLHRLRMKSASDYKRNNFSDQGALLSSLDQTKIEDNTAPHGSANIAIDYAADTLNRFSFGFSSWFGDWPNNNRLFSQVTGPTGTLLESYHQDVDTKAAYLGGDINFGYSRKFRNPGRELTLLAQFSPSKDKSRYLSDRTSTANELLYRELNNSGTKNSEWTFQTDYLHPFGKSNKYSFEGGFKLISRNVSNDYQVEGSKAGQPTVLEPISERNDVFEYGQQVYSGYAILKFNLPANWYIETGARLEHTRLNGNFIATGNTFARNFTNLIPTATLSKKLNETQSLSMSYTRRLTRPYIWDLNPNLDTSDPKNIVTGNPQLEPELADQAELSYAVSFNSGLSLNSALFWKQTNNSIEDFTITDANGISTTNKQNLAANRQLGLNFSAAMPLNSKWNINSNVNIYKLDFQSKALQVDNQGWNAEVNLNTSYKLPANFTLQAFGDYSSRVRMLQGYKTSRYFYSIAAKKEVPSKRLSFTLAFINPFNETINQREVINSKTFNSSVFKRNYNQTIKLSINWEFGKLFEQKESKKITNDDVKSRPNG